MEWDALGLGGDGEVVADEGVRVAGLPEGLGVCDPVKLVLRASVGERVLLRLGVAEAVAEGETDRGLAVREGGLGVTDRDAVERVCPVGVGVGVQEPVLERSLDTDGEAEGLVEGDGTPDCVAEAEGGLAVMDSVWETEQVGERRGDCDGEHEGEPDRLAVLLPVCVRVGIKVTLSDVDAVAVVLGVRVPDPENVDVRVRVCSAVLEPEGLRLRDGDVEGDRAALEVAVTVQLRLRLGLADAEALGVLECVRTPLVEAVAEVVAEGGVADSVWEGLPDPVAVAERVEVVEGAGVWVAVGVRDGEGLAVGPVGVVEAEGESVPVRLQVVVGAGVEVQEPERLGLWLWVRV